MLHAIEKFNITAGIVAIGDNWTRKLVVDRVRKIAPDFRFISTVHPKATLGKNVVIGNGSVIMPGVIINANSIVGDFCILNTNSSLGHDGRMNGFSSLAPGVITGGDFVLGKYSAVSLGSNIIENISIGSHTVIGAGSLVIMDIPNYVMAHGTPANIIRKREQGEKYLTGSRRNSSRAYISNYL